MRILIACEYSATVRDAFRKLWHDAWSCDILPCDWDSKYHFKGDVLEHLNDWWDMMIAHPPCTYLSNAVAARLYPQKWILNQERFAKWLEAKEFFMKMMNAPIQYIAVENPIPSTVFGLQKYTQIIQPFEHGHPYSKKTCLWLKNLPKIEPTNIVTENIISWVSGWSKDHNGNERKNKGMTFRDSKTKSKTFQGIADAMAAQWWWKESLK